MTGLQSGKSDSTGQWPPSFDSGTAPAVGFLLVFTGWVTISVLLFNWLFGNDYSLIVEGLWSVPSGIVQLGIGVAVLRYEGVTLGELGLSRQLLFPAVIAVLGVIVAVNVAIVGLASLAGNQLSFGVYAFYRSAPYGLSLSGVAITAFSSYVFIGPVEELLLRGYLQNKLISLFEYGSLRLRTAVGIVATGVIFSLLHIPARLLVEGMQVSQLAGTLVLLALSGVIFGTIYALTQNLYLVMFLHGAGDFWPLVVDPGQGIWPNYSVLLLIYLLLVIVYRQMATRSAVPDPTVEWSR